MDINEIVKEIVKKFGDVKFPLPNIIFKNPNKFKLGLYISKKNTIILSCRKSQFNHVLTHELIHWFLFHLRGDVGHTKEFKEIANFFKLDYNGDKVGKLAGNLQN